MVLAARGFSFLFTISLSQHAREIHHESGGRHGHGTDPRSNGGCEDREAGAATEICNLNYFTQGACFMIKCGTLSYRVGSCNLWVMPKKNPQLVAGHQALCYRAVGEKFSFGSRMDKGSTIAPGPFTPAPL